MSENVGAKFWTGVLNELANRSVQNILIAYMDGLTGFPEAVLEKYEVKNDLQLLLVTE